MRRHKISKFICAAMIMVLVWFVAIICYLGDLISHEIHSVKSKSITVSPKDVGYFDHIDVPEIKVPGFDLFVTVKYKKPDKKNTIKLSNPSTQGHIYKPLNPIQEGKDLQESEDIKLDSKNGYTRHSFNVVASDGIDSRRIVPDSRPESCQKRNVGWYSLPSASVIICFHNEAWSTLVRTINSAISMTPHTLLHQLILVDDFSTFDYLKKPLEQLSAKSSKIKLLRTNKREGLTRARLLGVAAATGDILVFLDSHCECGIDWLQPLVQAVANTPTKIACPALDVIDPDTFKYTKGPERVNGGFNWKLQFVWKQIPEYQLKLLKSESDAIRTPTLAGGVFAINRTYFYHLGGYDSGMNIWGSENLELSFRTWMCHGSIEIIPCSRVGHVFRRVIPYGFPGGAINTLYYNEARVAEVWLDQYKSIYYATQRAQIESSVKEGVKNRLKLRHDLHCQNFKWYLSTVIPEMPIPPGNARHFGQIKSKWNSSLCIEFSKENPISVLSVAECHNAYAKQVFTLTNKGLLHHHGTNIVVYLINKEANIIKPKDYKWVYSPVEGGILQMWERGANPRCLELLTLSSKLHLTNCDIHSKTSHWQFEYTFNTTMLNKEY